jgi:hypothetical protein
MKSNFRALFCISLVLVISGCQPILKNPIVKSPSVKAEGSELKISPCKYLEEAITNYANFGGTGIEEDPEVNKKSLNRFFQTHPDFPKSHKEAAKTWVFQNMGDQAGAVYCKYDKNDRIWKQIKIVKTKDFIALLTADLKLATETTPVRSQDIPDISSALVRSTNSTDRDLYNKLNRILEVK